MRHRLIKRTNVASRCTAKVDALVVVSLTVLVTAAPLLLNGFPRGWIGVGLAGLYGLFMGIIGRRAGGMFAPWLAHVFTDVMIVGMIMVLARTA
jgi:hypothetical protein